MLEQRPHPHGRRPAGLDSLHRGRVHQLMQDVPLGLAGSEKRHRIGARVVGGRVLLCPRGIAESPTALTVERDR